MKSTKIDNMSGLTSSIADCRVREAARPVGEL
jgi:hypothetical protein